MAKKKNPNSQTEKAANLRQRRVPNNKPEAVVTKKNEEKKPAKKDHVRLVARKISKSTRGVDWLYDKKAYILIPLIAILCFANTYNHEFTFDDQAAIKTNKDLLPESSWLAIFNHNYWGHNIKEPNSHKSYRPLTIVTFRLNYMLSGLNASSYHIGNFLLHALVSYLVAVLAFCLFNKKRTAFLSGLLFAVHPYHCDAVASVVGRAEVLGGVFMVSALIIFFSAVGFFRHKNQAFTYASGNTKYGSFALAIFLSILSLISKELAYLSSVLFGVYEVVAIYREERLVRYGPGKISVWRALGCFGSVFTSPLFPTFVNRQLINFAVFLLTMYVRYEITHSTQQYIISHFNYISEAPSQATRAMSIVYFQFLHWWPMVLPLNLACDCSFNSVPLITTWSDPRNLVSLAFYTFMFVLTPYYVLTAQARSSAPLIFCYFAAILPFIPCSNLWFWTGFEIAERVMYLPSIGFCLIVGHIMSQSLSKKRHGFMVHVFENENEKVTEKKIKRDQPKNKALFSFYFLITLSVILLFAARCVRRNLDWENQYTLWESTLKVYPNNAKAHYNFANELFKKGTQTGDMSYCHSAIDHYRSAVAQRHDGSYSHNFGFALFQLGQLEEAEQVFLKGLNEPLLSMDKTPVHRDHISHALHDLYKQQGKFEKAEECLRNETLAKMRFFRLPEDFPGTLSVDPTVANWVTPNQNSKGFKATLVPIDTLLDESKPAASYYTEGQKLIHKKDFQSAATWYFQKLAQYPGNEVLLFEASIILQLMGRYDESTFLLYYFTKENKLWKDGQLLFGKLLQDHKRNDAALKVANLLENIKEYENNMAELDNYKKTFYEKGLFENPQAKNNKFKPKIKNKKK